MKWSKTLLFLGIVLLANCQNSSEGKRLYQQHCANCHMDNGQGLAKLIPPLSNSDYLNNNFSSIPCAIRHGQKQKITVNGIEFEQEMPANPGLSIVEITNIMNFVGGAWGNKIKFISEYEVEKALNGCQ